MKLRISPAKESRYGPGKNHLVYRDSEARMWRRLCDGIWTDTETISVVNKEFVPNLCLRCRAKSQN